MSPEKKCWMVEYDHKDGRKGTVKAMTEISESNCFHYGNRRYGHLQVNDFDQEYDLRYNHDKDLHMVMLREFFGEGLVKATEI